MHTLVLSSSVNTDHLWAVFNVASAAAIRAEHVHLPSSVTRIERIYLCIREVTVNTNYRCLDFRNILAGF